MSVPIYQGSPITGFSLKLETRLSARNYALLWLSPVLSSCATSQNFPSRSSISVNFFHCRRFNNFKILNYISIKDAPNQNSQKSVILINKPCQTDLVRLHQASVSVRFYEILTVHRPIPSGFEKFLATTVRIDPSGGRSVFVHRPFSKKFQSCAVQTHSLKSVRIRLRNIDLKNIFFVFCIT